MVTTPYKLYSKELRAQAIAEAIAPGAVRQEVAERLGIDDQVIARWLREDYGTANPTPKDIEEFSQGNPPPSAPQSNDLTKLRATLTVAKTERDLLKGLLSHYMQRG